MKVLQCFLSVCFLFALIQTSFAQRQSILVAPQTTDPDISTNLSNHFISINPAVPSKNQLFVFFPGTGGRAINQLEINRTAADLGFHAINLNYPNDEAVNQLCGFPNIDLDCYGRVRLEILDGTDRTALIDVNRANSIENRLLKLLIYLNAERPAENWDQFLVDNTTIDWSKIIVSGHSQGGGHAGIIGRYHAVRRVIMFAAMDFNGVANAPANWIAVPDSTPNATPPQRFWGFSHQQDEFVGFTALSTRVWPAYGMPDFGAVVNVDSANPPYSNTHSLTSNLPCENAHGCVVVDARLTYENGVPVYKPVWEYLLSGTTSTLNLSDVQFLRTTGEIVSRPAVGRSTKRFRIIINGSGFEENFKVFINNIEVDTEAVSENKIRAMLPAGKFGAVGASTLRVSDQNNQTSATLSF